LTAGSDDSGFALRLEGDERSAIIGQWRAASAEARLLDDAGVLLA
jgi:hypothetical protein